MTAEDGVFTLPRVPKTHTYLIVSGTRIARQQVPTASLGDASRERLDDVEIVADQLVLLHVVVEDPAEADQFSLLDENGERLGLRARRAKAEPVSPVGSLVEGRSVVVAVPARAVTIVLLREGEEARRAPIDLHEDGLNECRP